MGKKSREKKVRREAKRSGSGPFLTSLTDLRKNIDLPEYRAAMKLHGEQFEPTLEKLTATLADTNPFSLLTKITAYCLTAVAFEDGTIRSNESTGLHQAHVELLQALILQLPAKQFPKGPAHQIRVQEIIDTILSVSSMFKAERHSKRHGETDVERAISMVQERVRMHTETIRNWGYQSRVKRIVTSLVRPLDEEARANLGFRFSDVVRVFDILGERSEELVNHHFDCLRGMMVGATPEGMIRGYYRENYRCLDTPEEFIQLMKKNGTLYRDAVISILSMHADEFLTGMLMFSAQEIAEGSEHPGLEEDIVTSILNAHSIALGALSGVKTQHLFLDNQVWTKPIISMGDRFFCFLPQVFFAFPFQTLDRLAAGSTKLKLLLDERRAGFLEAEVERLFRLAFPDAAVHPALKWMTADGATVYEQDLIVKLDSILIIVESKSGRVPPEALRGAPKSLRETIDTLLVEPSRQSLRFSAAVRGAKNGDVAYAHLRMQLPFDVDSVQQIARLTCTLDDFGAIQSSLNGLRRAGYVPKDLVVAPAMTLADLEVVFDILESPAQKFHYLMRRSALEGAMNIIGDELDLLGLYLQRGLNLGSSESEGQTLLITDMSKAVDDYYISIDLDVTPEKPKPKMNPRWQAMVKHLSKSMPSRWLEATTMLLDMAPDEQDRYTAQIEKIISRVRADREKASHHNAVVFVPTKGRQSAVVGLAFYDEQFEKRHAMMADVAAAALKHEGIKSCLVLGYDVDGITFPYRSLRVFYRDDEAGPLASPQPSAS